MCGGFAIHGQDTDLSALDADLLEIENEPYPLLVLDQDLGLDHFLLSSAWGAARTGFSGIVQIVTLHKELRAYANATLRPSCRLKNGTARILMAPTAGSEGRITASEQVPCTPGAIVEIVADYYDKYFDSALSRAEAAGFGELPVALWEHLHSSPKPWPDLAPPKLAATNPLAAPSKGTVGSAKRRLQDRLDRTAADLRSARADVERLSTTAEKNRAAEIKARRDLADAQAIIEQLRAAAQADHSADLQAALDETVAKLNNTEAELAAVYEENDALTAEVEDHHRRTAYRAGNTVGVAVAEMAPQEEPTFESWAELLTHAETLPNLWLSPDLRRHTAELLSPKASHLSRAWSALAALSDYASAVTKAMETSEEGAGAPLATFRSYIDSQVPGRRISRAKVALGEGTMPPRWVVERRFQVPQFIEPGGRMYVGSHIKIDRQPPAPRLYFLDDAHESGLVVICYLGPHLTVHSTTNT